MGLESFGVKGGRPKKEPPKKDNSASEENNERSPPVKSGERPTRYKFYLSCNKKCGFKRVMRKSALKDDDYLCSKCGKKMKLTKKE